MPTNATPPRSPDGKRCWIRPVVARLRVGDAENGYTRAQEDGFFAQSS